MLNKADVVVIGGGIHGASVAYHLAKKGFKKVVLLEKECLASGGTGRSGAGVRHQFGTEINIRLSAASIKMMENLQEDLEYPPGIALKKGGYLLAAYSDKELGQFKQNAALQNTILEVKSQILSPEEVAELIPGINREGLLGGSFNGSDGVLDPFHLTQAYANAAKRLGVEIRTQTEVTDLKTKSDRITGVMTHKGDLIETPVVVNAAGAHGMLIGKKVGVEIPICPERHQIMVSEPVEQFLPCMVLSFTHGAYFSQRLHGSLLMGIGDPEHEVKDFNEECSWQFLRDAAVKLTAVLPKLREARIVRQWAGIYDVTPDHQAILGKTELEGFYLDLGWSGHGLMMGPIVGKLLAELIAGEESELDISSMNLDRFKTGRLIPEPACV